MEVARPLGCGGVLSEKGRMTLMNFNTPETLLPQELIYGQIACRTDSSTISGWC
jgi:hypothetical protein